jgi:26S proteasome regulatory subunit N9
MADTQMDDHSDLLLQKSMHPELAEKVDEIDRLATQKLYHQMVTVLEELLKAPCYATPGNKDLVGLFDRFIKAFQTKMSDLRFIKMMQACLQQMDGDEAVAVLEPFLEKWTGTSSQVGQIVKGGFLTRAGKLQEALDLLEQRKEEMEGLIGIDAFVFSALYKNLAEIAKLQQDGPRFYKYALLYLAYTPVEDIPAAERSQFSIDVSEAALLAPLEFNFGELLDKPLIKQELSKAAPSHERLLQAFHEGSFQAFDAVMSGSSGAVPMPAHKAQLTSKMALASLMELVFQRSKTSRVFSFKEVGDWCRTEPNLVEHLIMKALSLGLVDGKMDEVDKTVTFTRVKPRVLDTQRIASLKSRIDAWTSSAQALCVHLDELTPELAVA